MVTINYLQEERIASRGDDGDETLTRRGRAPPVGHPARPPPRQRNPFRIDRDPMCRRARELL